MYKTIILLAVTTLLFSACHFHKPVPSKIECKIPSKEAHSFYNK